MSVEVLVPQMQDTLSQIRATISELSTKEQTQRLEELEKKRDRILADLQDAFEKERKELEKERKAHKDEVKKRRKQEDEEREAKRRQEDEELKRTNSKEDMKRQQKYNNEASSVEDDTEQQMNEIEEMAAKTIEEGKKKLQELKEKRKELNRRIDEQLQNIPDVPRYKKTKSRHEQGKKASHDAVDAAPAGSGDGDSTQSSSNKDKDKDKVSPSEPPKAKQHGEPPFQTAKSNDQPQAAPREHAQELTKSFAEALKDDVSNGSKENPNLKKIDSDETKQQEHDGNKIANKQQGDGSDMIREGDVHMGEGTKEDIIGSHEHETAQQEKREQTTRQTSRDKNKKNVLCEHPQEWPSLQSIVDLAKGTGRQDANKPSNSKQALSNDQSAHLPSSQDGSNKTSNTQTSSSDSAGNFPVMGFSPSLEGKVETVPSPVAGKPRNDESGRKDSGIHLDNNLTSTSLKQLPHSPPIRLDRIPTITGTGTEVLDEHIKEEACNLPLPGDEPTTKAKAEAEEDHAVGSKYKPTRDQPGRGVSSAPEEGGSREDAGPDNQLGRAGQGTSHSSEHDIATKGSDQAEVPRGTFQVDYAKKAIGDSFLAPLSFIEGDLVLPIGDGVPDFPPDLENQHTTSSQYLSVGRPTRRGLASPLPVENETVLGQDRLFDDDRSSVSVAGSALSEGEIYIVPCNSVQDEYLRSGALPTSAEASGTRTPASKPGGASVPGKAIERSQTSQETLSTPVPASIVEERIQAQSRDRYRSRSAKPDEGKPEEEAHPEQHHAPGKMLYSEVLSSAPDKHESPECHYTPHTPPHKPLPTTSTRHIDTEKPVTTRHSSSISSSRDGEEYDEASGLRHKRREGKRGRSKQRASHATDRALNPREQLFKENEENGVDIKSAWFKRTGVLRHS